MTQFPAAQIEKPSMQATEEKLKKLRFLAMPHSGGADKNYAS